MAGSGVTTSDVKDRNPREQLQQLLATGRRLLAQLELRSDLLSEVSAVIEEGHPPMSQEIEQWKSNVESLLTPHQRRRFQSAPQYGAGFVGIGLVLEGPEYRNLEHRVDMLEQILSELDED